MKKEMVLTRKSLLYALLGSSLLWQSPAPVYAEEVAEPQTATEQNDQSTAAPAADTRQSEFTLDGLEVIADKITDKGVAKRSNVGTKTDTALRDTPQSISIITREQLDARGAVDLTQALEYSAGITAQPYGNDTRWNWSLVRGFSSGAANTGVDGLRLFGNNFATWDFEPYGMEQLAILRGPSSTLYGSNSPGGLFSWTSKRPTSEQLRELRIQGGTDQYHSIAMDLGGKVEGQDNLTFRLTALVRDRDLRDDYSTSERTFIAPSLAWKIDEKTNITFQTHYLKDKVDGNDDTSTIYHPGHSRYGFPKKLFLGELGFTGLDREQYYYGYLLDHQVNDTFSLHQNFRYGQTNTVYKWHSVNLQSDGRTVKRTPLEIFDDTATSYHLDTYGQVNWESGALKHQTIAGIDYRHGNLEKWYGSGGSMPDLDIYGLNYSHSWVEPDTALTYKAKIIQTGIYAQDQIAIDDKWTATLSGRKDWYELNGLNPQDGTKTHIKQDAFTGRAGLVYHATSELSPYISYSESFEPQPGQDRHKRQFVPTTGQQYELGMQYEPTNMNARFTATLFDLHQQNVLTTDPDNTKFSIQTGEKTSKGLELEANIATIKGLNLTASYTQLNNKTTKSTNAAAIGRRTAGVSKHTAAIWLDTAKDDQAQYGWGGGIGARYIGSRYNSANTLQLRGVWLADAAIRYDSKDWQYKLNIRNLFDKEYEAVTYGTSSALGEERTIILTATRHW